MTSKLEEAQNRDKIIVRTSIVGIVANIALAAFKAAVGLLSNSIAIVLDAVNNLTDALSSVVTIVGAKLARKAPDRKHPYGYGRVEYFSTILIAVIVIFAGVTSLSESIQRIIVPEVASYETVTLVIVAVAVVAKIVLGTYVKRMGKKAGSGSLIASGTDALMDAIISASTLVAAFIYLFWGVSIEAWLGAIISVVIIKAGIDILREAIAKLLGERVDAELSKKVKETACTVEGVISAHDLILNDYGPDRLWGSIHVAVDEEMTAAEIDAMTRVIQMKVYEACGVIITGVGIYSTNHDAANSRVAEDIRSIAEEQPHVLEVHGIFVMAAARAATFDIVVSYDAPDVRAVRDVITSRLAEKYPEYTFHCNIDYDISD